MKRILALLLLACAVLSAQGTTGQNTSVQTTAADPTGDCRVQAVLLVSSNASNKLFACNTSTGVWGAIPLTFGLASTGTGLNVLQTSPTIITPTITAPVIATITNTGTVTLPTNTGGVPVLYGCGATSGNATCANTSGGATARVITGLATLASSSAVISGISPAFTGTTTFSCTSNDQTTVGNPTKVVNTSSSSITITNTTGASDVVAYVCIGY